LALSSRSCFCLTWVAVPADLRSFPTRRSSDLSEEGEFFFGVVVSCDQGSGAAAQLVVARGGKAHLRSRVPAFAQPPREDRRRSGEQVFLSFRNCDERAVDERQRNTLRAPVGGGPGPGRRAGSPANHCAGRGMCTPAGEPRFP